MNKDTERNINFTLGYYAGNRKTGTITVVNRRAGKTDIDTIETESESDLAKDLKPIFIGLTEKQQVILLNPENKQIEVRDNFPEDAFPAHIYNDPTSQRDWFNAEAVELNELFASPPDIEREFS